MTTTTTATLTAKTAHTLPATDLGETTNSATQAGPNVEQLLRDAAFVLRLTRRVKNDILRDAAHPNRPAPRSAELIPAALGV